MKRRTLSQPSKRRDAAAPTQAAQVLRHPVYLGRTVIEVIAGQLAGMRGVVVATGPERWSIQLEGTAHGVMLSIDPKWVRVVPADNRKADKR
jgi:hypothetical protein